jgi:thiosulfate/3-mercaptopyruvate sulfurtransferase
MDDMSYAFPDALVSTNWLEDNLENPNVRIIDGTCFLPNVPRDPVAEYKAEHIPGAVFFDINAISDAANPLPHMVPSADVFSSKVRKLGISDRNKIIVYDRLGFFAGPRVWWTFRAFGHTDIAVLNGGLPKWLQEGRPVTDAQTVLPPGHFTARFDPNLLRDMAQVMENLTSKKEVVVDGRPLDRFEGKAPEPRAGLKCGHIPGSFSLMPAQLIDPETKAVLPVDALTEQFIQAGADPHQAMLTTCGSGVAASAISLARYLLTGEIAPVYDGSWSEWGAAENTPVETGPAKM